MPRVQNDKKHRESCVHRFLIANSDAGNVWSYYNSLSLYMREIDRKYEKFDRKYYTNEALISKYADDLCNEMGSAIDDKKFKHLVRLKKKRHDKIVLVHREEIYRQEQYIRKCEAKKISKKRLKFDRYSYYATKTIAATVLPALTITELFLITLAPVFPILAVPAAIWSGVMALALVFKIVAFGCLLASLAFKFQSDRHKKCNDSLNLKIRTSKIALGANQKKFYRHSFAVKILKKVLSKGKAEPENNLKKPKDRQKMFQPAPIAGRPWNQRRPGMRYYNLGGRNYIRKPGSGA